MVRIKIKCADDQYSHWYRVEGGWQAKKTDRFQAIPYVSMALDPFDSELKDDGFSGRKAKKTSIRLAN